MSYYKIKPSDCIVVHDDIDLKINQIKVKIGGGNGGHNGLKSIDQFIGKEYYRIRCGVGRPENIEYEVADYVLSNFDKKTDDVNLISLNVIKLIYLWLNNTDDFLKRKQIIC
ncbi:MAG: hypothetical protein OEY79_03705 [Anaplasmataceae bacterium]|nr:hypothetical protein [Anaplasmataceae bacterium]